MRGCEAIRQQREMYIVDSFSVVDNSIFDLIFIENKNTVVVGTGDQSVLYIDIEKCAVEDRKMGHLGTVLSLCTFGSCVLSGGRDGNVCLWDHRTAESVFSINLKQNNSVFALEAISDKMFFTGDSRGNLFCWDPRNIKKPFMNLKEPSPNLRVPVSALSISPNRKYLASLETNNSLTFYAIENDFNSAKQTWGNIGGFYIKCCFSPCSRYLLTGSSSGSLNIFKVGQNEDPQVIIGHTASSTCVQWENNSFDFILSCSDDKTIQVWSSEYNSVEQYEPDFCISSNFKTNKMEKKKLSLKSTTLYNYI